MIMATVRVPYPFASRLCAAVFGTLTVVLLLQPGLIFWLFALVPSNAAQVLAARAAMLFAGLAMMMALIAPHPPSATRCAVSISICVALLGLAIMGSATWARGTVGPGIWSAIPAELGMAWLLWRAESGALR